ncbi:MAG: hypothetical protein LC775_16605, partial [Acidobacteria bacterium]|nr:hypothetical protein [Acidobacteriota bacterium]
VAYLFRYREVSLQANGRYLDALAVVDDPTNAKRDLDRVTIPKKDAAGRGCSGFNPLARPDAELFQSVMAGDHCLRGFKNRDIRARLASTGHLRACGHDPIKESAKVSRTFRRFHAHGLIAKVPRTSLACHPLRTPRHGSFALSPGPPLPGGLFQNRRMIYFVRCKEATAKESIYAPANAYSLAPSEFSLLVQPGGLHGFNWSSMKGLFLGEQLCQCM